MIQATSSLPNFVVAGFPRCGTTWLDAILRTHEQIQMALYRKEIHYFDRYYHRGIDWYKSHFKEADRKDCVGESTPRYLVNPQAITRMCEASYIERVIILMRDPVERVLSHCRHHRALDGRSEIDLAELVRLYPVSVYWSMYAYHIDSLLQAMSRENVLLLILEDCTENTIKMCHKLGEFLNVPPSGFNPSAVAASRKNQSVAPRWPALYRVGARIQSWLHHQGMHGVADVVKRLGIKELLVDANDPLSVSREDRRIVAEFLKSDVQRLRSLTGRRLADWCI